jgi:hypothetical protein
VRIILLPADAASDVGGKLYLLGAAWSSILRADQPFSCAVATKFFVPWADGIARAEWRFELSLRDADGELIRLTAPDSAPTAIRVAGSFATRPEDAVTEDADFEAGFVVNFDLALKAGAYSWRVDVGDDRAEWPFRVLTPEEAARRAQRERERLVTVTAPTQAQPTVKPGAPRRRRSR